MLELVLEVGGVFALVGGLMRFKDAGQRQLDTARKYYKLTFPSDMSDKAIHAFIRSIGKNLRGGSALSGVPTMVFEVWSSPTGIQHRLRVPEDAATYLVVQLQNALPGIDVQEIVKDNEVIRGANRSKSLDADTPINGGFQFGATLHMANSGEELPIANAVDYSYRILASMQDAIQPHDAVCVQWVIAHSNNQKLPPSDKPTKTQRQSALATLVFGSPKAGHDEMKSRRAKQSDQVYVAIGRVAARGKKVSRAEQLVRQVVRAYTSEGGTAHFWAKGAKPQEISHDIRIARTPLALTAQLSVTELAAVIGWPMNDTYIPGLQRGTTRHLPAQETVPRTGRVLGVSTMPGLDRQIAMDYQASTSHMYIAGGTGVGKTTLMVNTIRQDMEQGAGIILIEREGNLFHQALDQVPPHRMKDVICIDLTSTERPIGLNLLRTAKPEVVAGQLAALLQALYPDKTSIFTNQLVLHGIPVLANLPRATIADLIPLVHPRTPVEKQWARAAVEQVKDKTYKEYFENWYKDLDTRDQKQIANNSQPLKNRLWELLTPEPTRYLLNQETSSFDPKDVVQGNKLLFINLAGVSEQAASLIGTMIVTAIWSAAKLKPKPDNPTFMYLDEFQRFSHLSDDFEDMLAEARKNKLGLVIATQYIERLKPSMQDAVMTNARTKVIFNSSSKSSMIHWQDFASSHLKTQDFMNLKAHEALARVNTEGGVSAPVTIKTFKEPDGYDRGAEILAMSSQKYGRDKAQIDADDSTRRVVQTKPEPTNNIRIGRY